MVNRISAQIIADSLNEYGQRLTTYILVFPRIVLAEFNTHRMLSKNSASSRAIPFNTMVKKVKEEPFVPIRFQREHKGMQGTDYFTENDYIDVTHLRNSEMALASATNETTDALPLLEEVWLAGRDAAVQKAELLSSFGVTKQLCNRQLEPYLYHTVICTGSEWENFFALRAHGAAEIHIADLAHKMLIAYNDSTPKQLTEGQWHIPFGDTLDSHRIAILSRKLGLPSVIVRSEDGIDYIDLSVLKVKIATARCARVSYLNFEGKDDYEADIKLHDMLLSQGHMSPFEHCARAMNEEETTQFTTTVPRLDKEGKPLHYFVDTSYGWSGNFKGFVQYRKTIAGENKTDERVLSKINHVE